MDGWYERYLTLEKENALLRKEIQQMQDQIQKSYIRIAELRSKLHEKNSNS
jgi:hypothetical protein